MGFKITDNMRTYDPYKNRKDNLKGRIFKIRSSKKYTGTYKGRKL